MTKPANEAVLAELHAAVARVLKNHLTIEKDTDDEGLIEIANAPIISAAIKFLKDNEITSATGQDRNSEIDELNELMTARRKKKRVMETPLDTLN